MNNVKDALLLKQAFKVTVKYTESKIFNGKKMRELKNVRIEIFEKTNCWVELLEYF
jgi:hypothetical protein